MPGVPVRAEEDSRLVGTKDVSFRIPRAVQSIAWFYYVAAALGIVGTAVEVVRMFQTGQFLFAIPAGIGMSTWAIGRGLLMGSRRAWLWARGIAVALPMMTTAMVVLVLLMPGKAKISLLGESWAVEPWDLRVLGGWMVAVAVWGWQFLVLNSVGIRRLFAPPPAALPSEYFS